VAFDALAWKYYAIYLGILALWLVFEYFCFPETIGMSLEEVPYILDHGTRHVDQVAVGELATRVQELRGHTEQEKEADEFAETV
jgi:hypothetical protein